MTRARWTEKQADGQPLGSANPARAGTIKSSHLKPGHRSRTKRDGACTLTVHLVTDSQSRRTAAPNPDAAAYILIDREIRDRY